MKILHTACFLLIWCGMILSAIAQPLTLQVTDVNFKELPRISFKACIEKGGTFLRGLDSNDFSFTENSIPYSLNIRCPDPDQINSIALVLDNSGSMVSTISKLIEASGKLVDSMGANDECAIITFGRSVSLQQDFTNDKVRLKSVLQNMVASGGTPLFDACYRACVELAKRSGNRNAVVITDGEDNLSTFTLDDVILKAKADQIRMYSIAFNIQKAYLPIVEKMASETGGRFFSIARPSELTAVYETIADLITEKCCIAEYYSDRCADSVRLLNLAVHTSGDTASWDQSFTSPSRSQSLLLEVQVPQQLTPLATGMGYVLLSPPASIGLDLTIAFTLVYDDNLVEIPLLPFTLGTITQNQIVSMTKQAPGEIRFEIDKIKPALTTTSLLGFPVQALVSDSSKRVGFTIKDISLEGCPSTFSVRTDSMLICQCYRALSVEVDSIIYATQQGTTRIPIRIRGGLESGLPLILNASLKLPDSINAVDFQNGNLMPAASVRWTADSGLVRISVDTPTLPQDTSGVLGYLFVQGKQAKAVATFRIDAVFTELWQRCCPEPGLLPSVTIIQDGICEQIVVRKKTSPKLSAAPNPFSSMQNATTKLQVVIPQEFDGKHFRLILVDANGQIVQRLLDKDLAAGTYQIQCNALGLPSGKYFAVLQFDRDVVSSTLLYLR